MVNNTDMQAWMHTLSVGYHLDPKGLLHTIYCIPEIWHIFFSEYSQNYPPALKYHHHDAARSSWLTESDSPPPLSSCHQETPLNVWKGQYYYYQY